MVLEDISNLEEHKLEEPNKEIIEGFKIFTLECMFFNMCIVIKY